MRIEKDRLLRPGANDRYTTFAFALTFFIYAYSFEFSPFSILIYYALWLPLIFLDWRIVFANPKHILLPAGFAGLLLLSTVWSLAPSVTLRSGIQFASHITCAIVIARVTSLRSLTCGAAIGSVGMALYSLAFGSSSYDVIDGSYNFMGAFSSKNQLGLYASIGMIFCLSGFLELRTRLHDKIVFLAGGSFSMAMLLMSNSITSILSIMGAVSVFFVSIVFIRFTKTVRVLGLSFITIFLLITLLMAAHFGAFENVLAAFGKDTTLTGRTYLWAEGIRAGIEYLPFGTGYQAYWLQGFAPAERLWEEFYIGSRAGFHFHNTFIEIFVEVGPFGVFIFILTIVLTIILLVMRLISDIRDETPLMLCLAALFAARSVFEVDGIFAYTIGSFLFVITHIAACGSAPLQLSRSGLHPLLFNSSRPNIRAAGSAA